MMETQKSIYTWIKRVFPEWKGARGRALAIVEESTELALAAGLNPEEIQTAVDMVVAKHNERVAAGEPLESDEGEVADVLLCVYAYAEERSMDAQEVLDEKMAKNRAKPDEHYFAKTRQKRNLGLALEPTNANSGL